jgi:hypothetical protein
MPLTCSGKEEGGSRVWSYADHVSARVRGEAPCCEARCSPGVGGAGRWVRRCGAGRVDASLTCEGGLAGESSDAGGEGGKKGVNESFSY